MSKSPAGYRPIAVFGTYAAAPLARPCVGPSRPPTPLIAVETAASRLGMADPTLVGALPTLAQAARLLGAAEVADQAAQVARRLEGLVVEVAVVGAPTERISLGLMK
jgi:hypothetical protein